MRTNFCPLSRKVRIANEILMLMRTQKKTQGDVSLSETIGVDKEGNQIMLIDILKSDTADYENIKSELDERERKVIILRYGIGGTKAYTQREVAKLLNISRSYVSRIEKKAVGKLGKGIKEV